MLREGCCACKARDPTVEAWRFSECVQVFAEAQCPPRAEPVFAEAKLSPRAEPVQKPSFPREPSRVREPSKQCVAVVLLVLAWLG